MLGDVTRKGGRRGWTRPPRSELDLGHLGRTLLGLEVLALA